MKHAFTILLTVTCLALEACPGTAAVFADYTAFDVNAETATGVLNGVSFTLECTRAVPRPGVPDNGGVVGGVTNGSSGVFSLTPRFTPAQAMGDDVAVGATSDFKITFAQPVSDVTVHLSQLQANLLSFTTNGVAAAFTLLSSDGDFITSAGNTAIQGSPGGGDDASGSLFFAGTFTEFSWTSAPGSGGTTSTPDDGFRLQLSSESAPRLNITAPGVGQVQLTWSTNHTDYGLVSSPILPAASWDPVTNFVEIVGEQFSVPVDADEPSRFFRLRKN